MLSYVQLRIAGKIKYLFALLILSAPLSFSQIWMHSGNFNPDSLKPITVTGKVVADSLMMNGMYYLDADNDNKPDYILNFGPFWYKPDSSLAVRPLLGDTITITGGMYSGMLNYLPMIVVYTIDGNFWRSPYDALWNEMGHHSMMGGSGHMGMGYAFDWDHDSLHSINLNGIVINDSTFMYNHFYLDTNNDGKPDYFLNFGPPWYIPASGIKLPVSGNNISVSGWEMGTGFMNMIIVNKLNGQTWMDSTQINDSLGCGWIHKNMTQTGHFFSPFDTTNWMEVSPGWYQGGMGGGMMPDSLYCQILGVFPENVPNDSNQNTMAAFEVAMFYPNGMNGMTSGGMGGHMNFNSNAKFQFHFNDSQSMGFIINSGSIKVKYWSNQNNQWIIAANPVINLADKTVSISQSEVSNFYIVTSDKATGLIEGNRSVPGIFSLQQNYPNPFNPATTIEFSIKENAIVNLSVYNILGQKVTTLLNQQLGAGTHKVQFNASGLSSGIYFYKLSAGNEIRVMKMNLLK